MTSSKPFSSVSALPQTQISGSSSASPMETQSSHVTPTSHSATENCGSISAKQKQPSDAWDLLQDAGKFKDLDKGPQERESIFKQHGISTSEDLVFFASLCEFGDDN